MSQETIKTDNEAAPVLSDSEIFLPGPEDTRLIGLRLGGSLAEALREGRLTLPFLITLSGDLGAGKTTLCQAIGEALGVAEAGEIVSPTFALANEYQGQIEIFHLDVYRLESVEHFYEAGLDEYLRRPGLTLLEWPEKMPSGFWPEKRLDLVLDFKGAGRVLRALARSESGLLS